MKYTALLILTFGPIIFGCDNQVKSKSAVSAKVSPEMKKSPDVHNDKREITALIRQVLKWGDSKNAVDLLPALSKDSICIGFDFTKQRKNDEELRRIGFLPKSSLITLIKLYKHSTKK
jgi:hypothetical protein